MVQIEAGGENRNCPFCGRSVAETGACECGAEIRISDLSAAAEADGIVLTDENVSGQLQFAVALLEVLPSVVDEVAEKYFGAPVDAVASAEAKQGRVILCWYKKEGRYYGLLARQSAPMALTEAEG